VSPFHYGGTSSGSSLTLESTSDPSKGLVAINPNGGRVAIGTTGGTAALEVNGTVNAAGFTVGGAPLSANIQGPVTFSATLGASCSTVGQLAKDGSNNLMVCDQATPSLEGAGCSGVGVGALTLDETGAMYVCLN
jgi:hypothetical protein